MDILLQTIGSASTVERKWTHSKILEYIGFEAATRICRKASTAPKAAAIQPSINEPLKLHYCQRRARS